MKKIYSILFLTLLFAGCKKHVEITPVSFITSQSFFKTESDVQGALNGMYVRFRAMAEVNLFIWGEARSEIMTSSIAGTLGYDRYYTNALSTTLPGPDWTQIYSAINAANLIIKYTPQIEFASENVKKNSLAQAYTARAFLYFLLGKIWGGVPMRLEPTEGYDPATIQKPRATEAEVFTQVKADLDQALSLFADNAFPAGRNKWSRPAANALKGDVFLWTGKRLGGGTADITTALAALEEVRTADLQLLPNFADIFRYENKGNKEIIMAIFAKTGEAGSPNQVYAHNMYSSSTSYPAYVPQSQRDIVGVPLAGNGNVWRISELVRNQFTDDDKRKTATYVDLVGPGANQYYTNYGLKFNGTVTNGVRDFQSDFILYRYADILLMIAEAKNALGQDPTTEINLVRQRAYGADFGAHEFVPGSQEQNDEAILQERLFELTLEGKRWWDLVRFGKAFQLVPSLQGKESQPHLLYWPAGVALTTREPLVTETTGW